MVSQANPNAHPDGDPWRVLVVASDPEATSTDLLELEAKVVRDSLSNGSNGAAVDVVSTLHREEFVGALRSFRPTLVHFTRRGSVQSNIRLLDAGGWIRQITGRTVARLFREAGCRIPFLFFFNCGLFRERWHVSEFSEYLLTFKSKEATHQLPISLVQGIYSALGQRFELATTLNGILLYVADSPSLQDVEFRSFGRDPTGQLSRFGQLSLEPWREVREPIADNMAVSDVRRRSVESAVPLESVRLRDLEDMRVGELEDIGVADLEDMPVSESGGRRLPEEDGPRKYRVWFGTNRAEEKRSGKVGFGPKRVDRITYGYCDVTIPKHHRRIGSAGDSWWRRVPRFSQNNRLAIRDLQLLAEAKFHSQLQSLFSDLPDDARVLLVFLHGFNMTFNDAAIRAAQLGLDLKIPGTTAFFSWPSRGRVTAYTADIASMEASERHISRFLLEVSERSGASQIHLIAHSMANQGLLRGFVSLAQGMRERIGTKLKQVILAAPDIDEGLFRNLSDVYHAMATRTTMYVSSKDLALNSSGILHGHPRAGYAPPVTVVEGVDTVEVSNIDLTYLGHGYVAGARPVLVDMHDLMRTGADPNQRFGLQPALTAKGEKYWQIES